jgi:glycosyl transferase family 25
VPPPIFLINLARRPDRLAQMVAQLNALQLSFERVDATDAETASAAELEAALASHGPMGPFHRGPQCCTLSHLRTLHRFLATGQPHAVVLEDDVRLGAGASRVLRNLDWFPSAAGIVKIERFGPAHQRVLVERAISIVDGREVARLRSKHTGAAAYVITRHAATKVLGSNRKIDMDIDHLLFNPNVSPLFSQLSVYQMLPALAVQTRASTDPSDVAAGRQRARGLAAIERKIVRGAYEVRALPGQVMSVAMGRTRLARVGYR